MNIKRERKKEVRTAEVLMSTFLCITCLLYQWREGEREREREHVQLRIFDS